MIERLIAAHCAPALAGIKPSNIASCPKEKGIHEEIEKLNMQLNDKDIYAEIICECEKRVLIMVYRRKIMKSHLKTVQNREFLLNYGYGKAENISEYLNILKKRLKENEFPHEIGVFLGYPLHDIDCFINHRDEGCILTGEWKVYHNKEEAEKMFRRFKSCRKALIKKISDGTGLAQIFKTA